MAATLSHHGGPSCLAWKPLPTDARKETLPSDMVKTSLVDQWTDICRCRFLSCSSLSVPFSLSLYPSLSPLIPLLSSFLLPPAPAIHPSIYRTSFLFLSFHIPLPFSFLYCCRSRLLRLLLASRPAPSWSAPGGPRLPDRPMVLFFHVSPLAVEIHFLWLSRVQKMIIIFLLFI